jgi:hypothetical protein
MVFSTGCKKKQPTPEPAGPVMTVDIGPAAWPGRNAAGGLSVPITVGNQRDGAIDWKAAEIRLFEGDKELCSGKQPVNHKVAGSSNGNYSLEVSCQHDQISGSKVDAKGTIIYTIGGEEKRRKFAMQLTVQR